jgi:hypothetical protein
MTKLLLPSLCLFALVAACGGEPAKSATPAAGAPSAPAEHHGDEHPLGQLTIGSHTFQVVQEGDVAAGAEAAITLEFPADKPLPDTVRVWFGVESGQGSMKARLGKEGAHARHGHVVVPKPLPEGSKVWIEIDENDQKQRASIAWHE